jgi:hypothetical protein
VAQGTQLVSTSVSTRCLILFAVLGSVFNCAAASNLYDSISYCDVIGRGGDCQTGSGSRASVTNSTPLSTIVAPFRASNYLNSDTPITNLWQGSASFKPIYQWQIATNGPIGNTVAVPQLMDAGTEIVAMSNYISGSTTWYLFNREFFYDSPPANCPISANPSRIVVRASPDQGQSWTNEYVIAAPNFTLGECEVTDGHAFYDVDTNTWHYLAQVLTGAPPASYTASTQMVWNINHYSLPGNNPLAPFNVDSLNPVVKSGALWNSICNSGRSCPAGTSEEGTPEISFKANGYYYVTFHGAYISQGASGPPATQTIAYGYRGIAKTADFHTWITYANDTTDTFLPDDAVWSKQDCADWRIPWQITNGNVGCVGGGHASSLITPDYTYMLIESPDKSLGCTEGQDWVIGLVRAPRVNASSGQAQLFVASGQWQQYTQNPFMNARNHMKCGVQYQRFFVDSGQVYLTYWTLGAAPGQSTATATDGYNGTSFFHVAQLTQNQPCEMSIAPGTALTSGNSLAMGNYSLSLQTNGNLQFSDQFGFPLWSTNTTSETCTAGNCSMNFQTDGNLVLYNSGTGYWQSTTAASEITTNPTAQVTYKGISLLLSTQEPYLQIDDAGGDILWTDSNIFETLGLNGGNFIRITSASSLAFLFMQTDGNLVAYSGSTPASTGVTPLWSTNTGGGTYCSGAAGCRVQFQTDGNLVLYNSGTPYWSSATYDTGASWLSLSDNYPYVSIFSNTSQVMAWNSPNTNGYFPSLGGSYKESCSGCGIKGNTLTCLCRNASAGYVTTSLNLAVCPVINAINNINGLLTCN